MRAWNCHANCVLRMCSLSLRQEFGRSAIRLLESELDVEEALRLAAGSAEEPAEAASFEACFKRSGACQISEVPSPPGFIPFTFP